MGRETRLDSDTVLELGAYGLQKISQISCSSQRFTLGALWLVLYTPQVILFEKGRQLQMGEVF